MVKTRYTFWDTETGLFVSKAKWTRSRTHGGKRYRRRRVSVRVSKKGKARKGKSPKRTGTARPTPRPRKPRYKDYLVRWSFAPEPGRKHESPSRELSFAVRARSADEAISQTQGWILAPDGGQESDFDYGWALDMDEQELWSKTAIELDSPIEPRLKNGEVQERQ